MAGGQRLEILYNFSLSSSVSHTTYKCVFSSIDSSAAFLGHHLAPTFQKQRLALLFQLLHNFPCSPPITKVSQILGHGVAFYDFL
jgi:hypothetical protein